MNKSFSDYYYVMINASETYTILELIIQIIIVQNVVQNFLRSVST